MNKIRTANKAIMPISRVYFFQINHRPENKFETEKTLVLPSHWQEKCLHQDHSWGPKGHNTTNLGTGAKNMIKGKSKASSTKKGPLATQHVCYSPPWACEKSKGFRQDYHWHALKNGKILIRYQLLTQPDQILGWYYPCRCQTRS